MVNRTRGSKPTEEKFNTSEVEKTEAAPSSPTPVKDAMIDSSFTELKPPKVEAADPVSLPGGMSRVNLQDMVSINGRQYGPGVGVLVPTDAFDVWRNALAKE